MIRSSQSIAYLLCAMLLAAIGPAAVAQSYHALAEYTLPGSSANGIAVDAVGRRLLVATDAGVAVLNADTGASLGMVPLTERDRRAAGSACER